MTEQPQNRRASNKVQPAVVVFDVNETLSDMAPLANTFERVGLDRSEAEPWFAGVLRDGFALTSVGVNPSFSDLASEALRIRLAARDVAEADVGSAVDEIMGSFGSLGVHTDVVAGVRALKGLGIRLVTLSNGATSVAEGLLERAGISDAFERLLSVADAPAWKPHSSSYAYALSSCGVDAADAMLIAVHPWDVDGAGRAGLRSGWLNRNSARYPSYFREADLEAPDLLELADIFRSH
jgi:2-haloacid dehalogenase